MASIGQTKQWNSVVPHWLEPFPPAWHRTSWVSKIKHQQTIDISSPQHNSQQKHTSLSYDQVLCANLCGTLAAKVLIWEKDGHLLEFLKPSDDLIQLPLAERDSLKPCRHVSIFGVSLKHQTNQKQESHHVNIPEVKPSQGQELHNFFAIKYKWLSWEPTWYRGCIYEADSSQKFAKSNPKP